ncbi:FimD/PapC N-terminal domain-containing protein, partial [Rahnella aceris]|uniref:FimD/PapC N-terminal domain-containing protein n=1 Tax=Rahnella sp. (strain Y9602) TaxID=2703885 RepID=UPI00365783B2
MLRFPARKLIQLHFIYIFFLVIDSFSYVYGNANEIIQFNTDVLDVKDRENIDLSQFSRRGYIMPGNYTMVVH